MDGVRSKVRLRIMDLLFQIFMYWLYKMVLYISLGIICKTSFMWTEYSEVWSGIDALMVLGLF